MKHSDENPHGKDPGEFEIREKQASDNLACLPFIDFNWAEMSNLFPARYTTLHSASHHGPCLVLSFLSGTGQKLESTHTGLGIF
jgi:hypothetical protein